MKNSKRIFSQRIVDFILPLKKQVTNTPAMWYTKKYKTVTNLSLTGAWVAKRMPRLCRVLPGGV